MTFRDLIPPPDAGPWACIDTKAIAHNLAWARRQLSGCAREDESERPPRLWAVVKADAYGHGLSHALAALETADGLCVAQLTDAMEVRRLGWEGPVLVLSLFGVTPNDLRDPALGELHIVVNDAHALHDLESLSAGLPHVHAWLRYAGHLRNQGFDDADYAPAFRRLLALARSGTIAGAGHLHHYAASEEPSTLHAERLAFSAVTAGLPGPHCAGNSAALCGGAPVSTPRGTDWQRCGLALYGASALWDKTGAQLGLRPAMSVRARLHALRRVAAGQTVGYGDSFRAEQETCIGVVGIGYGHGVPRQLWQRGTVLIGPHDRPVRLAGRVAMDCLTVDLGPRATERPGDIVTLWGRSPNGSHLPVETVAQSCGTIAAELLTGLTSRVPLRAV